MILKIRKQRTIKESQIISQVKSFGIPTPIVYFVNTKKSSIIMQEIPGTPVHDLSESKIIQLSQKNWKISWNSSQKWNNAWRFNNIKLYFFQK